MTGSAVVEWRSLTRGGVRLALADFGGTGRLVVLLHGLAGHALEWAGTAVWLRESRRVVAPDARGHGGSERRPADVSREAHIADVVAWLAELQVGRVTLVGQSLGGQTAFLVAAAHPDLVERLVVVEATPAAAPDVPGQIRARLAAWPAPFPTREAALAFFGGDTARGRAWVDGLEPYSDGLRPRFDTEVLVATITAATERSFWDEWSAIRCPTLVVRAEHGIPRDDARRMLDLHHQSTLVEIPGTAHDVHLEEPEQWREALLGFLV
jgi:pimeloyl-ACP methyl ester carboxylesterase